MEVKDFVKFYPLRSPNIVWFLGAGASVSAGIRTAYDMIWDFKRIEYCADQKYPLPMFSNLSSPAVRNQIQSFFDSKLDAPEMDSPEEYSYYFELVYPNIKDRRDYIANMVSQIKPSYGHRVMGALMNMKAIRYVFTTNFDKAIENISAEFSGNVDNLYIGTIDNADSAVNHLQRENTPLLIKLHGDYHSQYLKNTQLELQEQDKTLRLALLDTCRRYGFAFMGYSGRDNSIMDVLEEAIESQLAFPQGLFWFIKTGTNPLPRVTALIKKAKEMGIDAHFVESETFDETFADIFKGFTNISSEVLTKVEKVNLPVKNKTPLKKGIGFPVIRLNALEVISFPQVARIMDVSIGNTKEVKDAVEGSKAEITCIRRREGVVGFGSDNEFEKAFNSYGIKSRSVFTIPAHQMMYDDSTLKELLTETIVKALVRDRPLKVTRRSSGYYIFLDPKGHTSDDLKPLTSLSYPVYGQEKKHQIYGTVLDTSLKWVDAVKINLTFQFSSIYLILDPTIIVQKSQNTEARSKISPFVKEHLAGRLNQAYNSILDAWIKVLLKGEKSIDVSTYGGVNGFDANFKINSTTSFTRPL
jgi:NAD-dependent SIR2 family protein deacetylase